MREETKDAVEDAGTVGAAALLGYVPVLGPLLAVGLTSGVGSAAQRRTKRILGEVVGDLERLRRTGLLDEGAFESEQFLSAAQRTARMVLEAETEEKRKLLRNALLNRAGGAEVDRDFDRLLDRLEEDDVRVLQAMESLMEGSTEAAAGVWSWVEYWFQERGFEVPTRVRARIQALARDGLLTDMSTQVVEDVRVGRNNRVERHARSTFAFTTSDRGAAFLRYVRDPLA